MDEKRKRDEEKPQDGSVATSGPPKAGEAGGVGNAGLGGATGTGGLAGGTDLPGVSGDFAQARTGSSGAASQDQAAPQPDADRH